MVKESQMSLTSSEKDGDIKPKGDGDQKEEEDINWQS